MPNRKQSTKTSHFSFAALIFLTNARREFFFVTRNDAVKAAEAT
jgi:hypothetical protein